MRDVGPEMVAASVSPEYTTPLTVAVLHSVINPGLIEQPDIYAFEYVSTYVNGRDSRRSDKVVRY